MESVITNCVLPCLGNDNYEIWIEDAANNNNLTIEETACENFYKETTTRHDDGRFVVRLPQKADMINSLGELKSMVAKRSLAIEKRLDKEPATREAYSAFMKKYEELGQTSVASKQGDGHSTAYYSLQQGTRRRVAASRGNRHHVSDFTKPEHGTGAEPTRLIQNKQQS